jgi:hypothetical protein
VTRPLKRAILNVFEEGTIADESFARLSVFGLHDWVRCYQWLDSSGLALYFLDRLKTLGIVSVLPPSVLTHLEKNQAANRERMASIFADFALINEGFQAKHISYFNTKGFALVPVSCPNPALRIQINLDFVMSANDAELCHDALADLGYSLARYSQHVWEFATGRLKPAYPMNFYEFPPLRAVKVYAVSPTKPSHRAAYQQLVHKRVQSWNGCTFPVASNADAFINQSLHIFGRICSEWTRLSWLIEYKSCLNFWGEDDNFLQDVLQKAQNSPDRVLAIGIALALIKAILGAIIPSSLEEWTIRKLNASVRLWIQHYADEALMADYPGTKRYCLLKDILPEDRNVDGDERDGDERHSIQVSPFFSRVGNVPRKTRQRHPYMVLSDAYSKVRQVEFHLRENLRNLASAGHWRRLLSETRAQEMRREDDVRAY